ncbi:MAG: SUMF1/EgtB/PvdO family nonheme iron enzyme, partial [Caldilineaceae bacterium]|nr:SUMF1/EgtB/PvdO family nonheme iron enzyme [Caldilineaceae bacterium]
MTDDTFDAGTFAINADLARASVDWFVDSHGAQGDAYRLLACYAAMPLVLTPELLNYLHNRFLAHLGLPWVAEVDLLLSDLLRPVDAELYAMPPATRAYLLDELRRRAGEVEMQRVARVLIHYTRHLARTNPYLDDEELRTQQWAAMVYLDETRATAAREVAEAFAAVTTQLAAQPVTAPLDVQRAEFARLAHITRLLAPQLREHRALVEYAALVRRLLAGAERGVSDFTAQVEGVTLRVPEQLRPQPAPTTSGSGVDVTIQISLAPDGIYTVAIRAMGEQSGFSRSFDATAAARLATCLGGGTAEAGAARDLRVLGETLYDFLIAGGDDGLLHRALVRGSEQGGATLRLQIDPPDLAALPWEALHDGRGFLALGDDFSVIRTLPRSQPARPLASGAPLRIVAAAADPTDASPTLDQALERERVMQALAPLQAVGLAQITWLENATVKALYTALQEDADIFYFSGHGGFEPERGGGLLLLAGEAGGAQPVDASDLTSLLAKRADLRLAILNTDLSAHGDATAPALAAALMQAGLPAAIGMQGTISDTGAIRFAQRLFDALARGRTVGAAVQAARRELAAAEPEGFEWVLPVLYTSAPDEALISVPVAEQEDLTPPVVFDWVEIPAGPFLMGSDKRKDDQAYDDELPQHTMTLPAYRMARMPVMVAQFAAFVEATGYMTQAEQQGSAYVWTGQKWDDVKGANWRHPRGPESDVRQKQAHPVTCVTFRDVVGFCEWASRVTGTTVRLPSEAEWEKAA